MNRKSPLRWCLLVALALPACRPSPAAVQTAIAETAALWTVVPTTTAIFVVQTRLVAPTPRPTLQRPTVPPTPTVDPLFTPPPTATLQPTADALRRSRGNGFYLVGVDIAPGVWKSTGSGDDCYWGITRRDGELIDNHFGMAGGTAYIPTHAFQVEFNDCGTWEYLGPP